MEDLLKEFDEAVDNNQTTFLYSPFHLVGAPPLGKACVHPLNLSSRGSNTDEVICQESNPGNRMSGLTWIPLDSAPSRMSLMKILNNTRESGHPCRMPLRKGTDTDVLSPHRTARVLLAQNFGMNLNLHSGGVS